MEEQQLTADFINKKFFKNSFKLYHSSNCREYWDGLDIREDFQKAAEKYKYYTPKVLLASSYLRFIRDGNRTEYEGEYFERRDALRIFTILEAIENNGEYIDRIINIVWAILEETTWVLPAHWSNVKNLDGLPDGVNDGIDLFAAETSSLLAMVYEILGEKLDEVTKNISGRMLYEINRRIIDKYLDETVPKWWFGYNSNWNVWIHSNILAAAPVVCKDGDKLAQVISRADRSITMYAECQPEDGACEEGPMYWNYAGAALIDCEWLLYKYSAGEYNRLYTDKLKEISRYFMKMYICGSRVANYCDTPGICIGDYGELYKLGKIYKDYELISLAKQVFDNSNGELLAETKFKPYNLPIKIKARNELKKMPSVAIAPKSYYLKSVEITTNYMQSGLFFSAIAGNNGVGHNHNDVGSFIIYKNSVPFIIDIGSITYEKDTFTDKRYTIWNNMSEYHNLPKINGKNQHEGKEYSATDVAFGNNRFSFDMKNAYVNRDEIVRWRRSFDFSGKVIIVEDNFELNEESEIVFNFILTTMPEICGNEIILKKGGQTLKMQFYTSLFEFETEEINTPDVTASWNGSVYRLKAKLRKRKMKIKLIIE